MFLNLRAVLARRIVDGLNEDEKAKLAMRLLHRLPRNRAQRIAVRILPVGEIVRDGARILAGQKAEQAQRAKIFARLADDAQ